MIFNKYVLSHGMFLLAAKHPFEMLKLMDFNNSILISIQSSRNMSNFIFLKIILQLHEMIMDPVNKLHKLKAGEWRNFNVPIEFLKRI